MDSRWLGQAQITGKEGEHSDIIQIKPAKGMTSNVTFLIPYVEERDFGEPLPLFYHQRTEKEDSQTHPDEWIVEKKSQITKLAVMGNTIFW